MNNIFSFLFQIHIIFRTGEEERRHILTNNSTELPNAGFESNATQTIVLSNVKSNSTAEPSDQLLSTNTCIYMHGLPTIRAMKAQNVLTDEFDNHQDLHSSCWFMYISTNSAFGLCLDFLCFLIVSCITFTFLLSGNCKFFFRTVEGN